MKAMLSPEEMDTLWSRHHAEWRDGAQIISQWREAAETDPQLLRYTVRGRWWETLAERNLTLLVTREYEHMLMAMRVGRSGRPSLSYMRLPHPSGLAVDHKRGIVHVASTRNPNQVYDLAPVSGLIERLDVSADRFDERVLVPTRSRFLPGSLYMHDLALIGGKLHANAVGQNCVIQLNGTESFERVWWPRCIEADDGPVFGLNYIQLNSIAAGPDLAASYFSASTSKLSSRRPGHRNFPVDGRGVIFSGRTREPVLRGLTRPHSARLHQGRLWVANSGYGEIGFGEGQKFRAVARLPGWTRGLCAHGGIAFVGTSRVIPRFRQYAPGLDVDESVCGVHALDVETGRVMGSLLWPFGSQIFAVDWIDAQLASGLPFVAGARRAGRREKILFYAFETGRTNHAGAEKNERRPHRAKASTPRRKG